jgi:hypothetical protein
MKFNLTLFALIFSLISACGHRQNESKHADETVMEEHQHGSGSAVLELDSGRKWMVNPEMMVHVRNIENDVDQFSGTTLSDFKSLAEKLVKHNALVVSSCTMQGKAHEELHDWLLPFIDLNKKFLESGKEIDGPEYFMQVKSSVATFNEYFQ